MSANPRRYWHQLNDSSVNKQIYPPTRCNLQGSCPTWNNDPIHMPFVCSAPAGSALRNVSIILSWVLYWIAVYGHNKVGGDSGESSPYPLSTLYGASAYDL